MSKFDFLIIGNSAAAVGAVEAIRGVKNTGSIGIISSEPYHVYSRPMISDRLTENADIEDMAYRPSDFYDKNRVSLIAGRTATAVHPNDKRVNLDVGDPVEYGKLMLSTGAKPIKPPIPGVSSAGVHFFTTFDEACGVADDLTDVHEIVVIGGGLIGMQAAEALCKLGRKVTVVEMCDRVLALNLDEHASSMTQAVFEEHGVSFRCSNRVNEIVADEGGRACSVILGAGEKIGCQLVVVAAGVAPRIELAKELGIACNKGIVVNEFMQTSVDDIYAAGDIAEAYDLLLDQHRLIPIWPNAYLEGRCAGMAMAGKPTPFRGEIAMNSAHFFGFPVISAGITEPGPGITELLDQDAPDGCYRRIFMRKNVPIGMVMTGDAVDNSGIILNLIKNKSDATAYLDKLGKCSFDSAHLPPEQREIKREGKETL